MDRRGFFKAMAGAVIGLSVTVKSLFASSKPVPMLVSKQQADGATYKCDICGNSAYNHICITHGKDWCRWRFYINGEEVDGSKAVDEHGALHWPFQGSEKGDLCTAKSPEIYM